MSELVKRFFRYVAIPSQSDESATSLPSSMGQLELAKLLASELEEIGASTHIDENGCLYAELSGDENLPSIGFCAHLDTVDVGLNPAIKPQILRYEGADLDLGKAIFKAAEHPEAAAYINQDIIFSDGSSVLGADDKAAIAIIMQLAHDLKDEPNKGTLKFCFVPDEEIGLKGSKVADLNRFNPDYAYTIDCCELGELVYETFNAASAVLDITGVSAHPMSAKGVMINPISLGFEVFSLLDKAAVPELTELREGYVWLNNISGGQNTAKLHFSIRDHDKVKFEQHKKDLQNAVDKISAKYPRASLNLSISDTYSNIKDALNEHNSCALDRLKRGFKAANIEPKIIPMRGGTDGSAFAARGFFVPNFFTGAHNFHSRFEFLPISSFLASYQLARELVNPNL